MEIWLFYLPLRLIHTLSLFKVAIEFFLCFFQWRRTKFQINTMPRAKPFGNTLKRLLLPYSITDFLIWRHQFTPTKSSKGHQGPILSFPSDISLLHNRMKTKLNIFPSPFHFIIATRRISSASQVSRTWSFHSPQLAPAAGFFPDDFIIHNSKEKFNFVSYFSSFYYQFR